MLNPEESKVTPPSEQPTSQAKSQREPPAIKVSKRASKSRPVTVYLAILFLVALLLLVMSFFMQQRSNEALENLNESMLESQDVTTLQMENQRLTYELEDTKDRLAAAQEFQKETETKAANLEKQVQALEWLRQIEGAVRSSYPEAKALVESFEHSDLPQYLPDVSAVEGEESPAESYRNIYAMLY